MRILRNTLWTTVGLFGLAALIAMPTAADQVILDDLIVDGSICAGFDCVNGESFGFDTIRIKENNLRIRAMDTSTSASFPTNDWQITFNASSNGGAEKFSIDDITGARTPFTIEAGAPSHSLYVDDGGRLGFGTSTPVVDLHVKSGNTPTLRLEQDGSSGFAAQTWDVAGNEANFFIRDASNGSTLPLRIFPAAPSNALTIEASTGDIGVGTTSPIAAAGNGVHIKGSGNNHDASLGLGDDPNFPGNCSLNFTHSNGVGFITTRQCAGSESLQFFVAGATPVLTVTNGGADVTGTLTVNGGPVPDYVFQPDYPLESIEEHAAYMWQNSHLPALGKGSENGKINVGKISMGTLEELEKAHIYIAQLNEKVKRLEELLEAQQ